ncbi:hypothetical protein KIW84_023387 [Lathyrus oleraceus]|uniref:Uncharacterized protein n=1 Tax=Pisum sativum TaxID=3888 RepID=A0A9D5BBZ1_PEA|nr:hypothetical protein KIW84_023387 [Pisum sativum]
MNRHLRFSRGLRPLNYDEDVLEFVEDVNGFELVDVYLEHTIDKIDVVDEVELGKEYDEEVHVDGSYGPKYVDDEVEVDSVNVSEDEA